MHDCGTETGLVILCSTDDDQLFFSIMFSTICNLGLKNLGVYIDQAISFIAMGIVGAVFPILMGQVAIHDVAKAYYLLILCYFVIFLFWAKCYKVKNVIINTDEKS